MYSRQSLSPCTLERFSMSPRHKTARSKVLRFFRLNPSADRSRDRQDTSLQPSEPSTNDLEIANSSKVDELEQKKLLLDIYKVHVDEYRYNVSLTWDRTRYLLTLNSTLTVAALTLFRFADATIEYLFLGTIFFVTILMSWYSIQVALLGKQYFRNSKRVLHIAEERLGLHTEGETLSGLGIASTDEHSPPNEEKGTRLPTTRMTITRRLRVIFYVLIAINFCGLIISGISAWVAFQRTRTTDPFEGFDLFYL